jgi:hypothetical protein
MRVKYVKVMRWGDDIFYEYWRLYYETDGPILPENWEYLGKVGEMH